MTREIGYEAGDDGSKLAPGRAMPRVAMAPMGSKPKRMSTEAGGKTQRLDVPRDDGGGVPRGRTEFKVERDPGVEMDAAQRPADRLFARRQRVAVIAGGSREDEHDAVRTVAQIVEDLRVGGFGVGKIDPLHHGPGRAGGAGLDETCLLRARVKRLDDEAVIGGGAERFEARALQRLGNQRLPRRFSRGTSQS